uniref:Uncharacterized protein n=1 Tax=Anguilla anguilla TaxID=7936 RepID=A0A0E9PY95_ANGAN
MGISRRRYWCHTYILQYLFKC